MFKFLKITCKEANEICNKAQYNEATFMEKIKLNLHLLVCKICAMYSKQNKLLTKTYGYKTKECNLQKVHLSEDDKQKLKDELKKQLQ